MPPLSNTRFLAAAAVGALLLPSAAEVSADPGGEESNRQLANNSNNNSNNNRNRGRSWQDLIPKRRTIPPYDRYRYALVTEWDPFYDLPLSALSSWEKSKNSGARGSTPRPTNFPTQYGVDVLDQMPPTRRPTIYVPSPTPAPTFGPTTLGERAELCGIDGHGFLSVVTLKDKWGDGWDGARLTIRDSETKEALYSSTLNVKDGKHRVDYICLKVWRCYEVIVTGSQWSDEISWRIDRMQTDDYFKLMINRDVPLQTQLASGLANERCTFAITDTNLMDSCTATCAGSQFLEPSERNNGNANGIVAQPHPNGNPGRPLTTTRPPTASPTLSDDFRDFGGSNAAAAFGRQPSGGISNFGDFDGAGGRQPAGTSSTITGAGQRPSGAFNPFDFGNTQFQPRPGSNTAGNENNIPSDPIPIMESYRGSYPTPSPTASKPTLPPVFDGMNVPPRPEGYYNYDPFDGYYGPMAWGKWWPGCKVGVTEFDKTGTGIAGSEIDGRQTPMHLGEGMNVECEATHEIRARAAEFSICDDEAGLFSITPSRLRLDFTAKKQNPETDLPDGFGVMTAKYLEVAYPAIHTIEENGRWKRYDAEYTILHDFEKREKATLISILIDASGIKNERFQDLLDEWAKVDTCRTPENEEQFLEQINQFNKRRQLRNSPKERELACAFNIYHRTLMPSTYYYAYRGSLPEPPCTYKSYLPGTSEWRVINKPMKISQSQLQQLKNLIESGPCSEYADDMGIWRARPVQESEDRPYWQCKRDDFPLDCEKDGGWCDCDAILCPEDFD